jgi:membrane-associated phospholipid phosphatase
MTDALHVPAPIGPAPSTAEAPATSPTTPATRPWWRTPPVDRRGLVLWVATFVVMTVVIAGVGLLLTHDLGSVRSFDDRVARWLARHRTDTWDHVTWVGSFIADAYVKIPVTVVLCIVFVWRWRRWTEPALLAGALVLEVGIFTLSSFVVDRPRPPIPHLDPIPPTGAFPSGHSAAAVAFYGAIAIIVCWHTRNRIGRTVAIAAAFLVPLAVGGSRLYRGMHHLSDVVVGLVIGIISLWVTWRVVRNGPAARLTPGTSARQVGDDAPVSASTS